MNRKSTSGQDQQAATAAARPNTAAPKAGPGKRGSGDNFSGKRGTDGKFSGEAHRWQQLLWKARL